MDVPPYNFKNFLSDAKDEIAAMILAHVPFSGITYNAPVYAFHIGYTFTPEFLFSM